MKRGMMARMRSRWLWVIASLFLLCTNFIIACGDSPTESRQLQKEENNKDKEDEKK